MESLGTLLKRYRLAAGWTQAELAERAGLSVYSISNLERAVALTPRKDTVVLLANALGLSPEEQAALIAAIQRTRSTSAFAVATESTPGATFPITASTATGATTSMPSHSASYHLPAPPRPLLGRAREAQEACTLLPQRQARLLTLAGPAGVGKTHLALVVAREMLDVYADGCWFVSLAPLNDPQFVVPRIIQTLGLSERGTLEPLEQLQAHLRDKQVLLVLDNFEQVAAAASQVAELLSTCPGLAIMVTSRAVLRVRGEQVFQVSPLALPDAHQQTSVETLAQVPSVALFVACARAVAPHFILSAKHASAVAAICRRLDGLPLAIELAASWLRLLTPQTLLARLEHRLPLLIGGPLDLPAHQRTLQDTLAWSYDLLPVDARTLFRRLGAFADGCALDDVEAVCNTLSSATAGADDAELVEEAPLLDRLSILVDHHLLRPALDGETATPRFAMLETIREYAVMALEASGEAEAVRQAHTNHYLRLAETARSHLRGPDAENWLARLREQHDNFRMALQWLSTRGKVTAGLRLAGALWRYWYLRGTLSEGRRWLEYFLSQDVDAVDGMGERAGSREDVHDGADVRALALHGMGVLCALQGAYDQATATYEEALTYRRALGDRQGIAATLNNLGSLTLQLGAYVRAETLLAEALAIKRELGDQRGIASSLGALASVALYRGDYDGAERLNHEAITVCRAVGDQHDLASALNDLANVAYFRGECDRARGLCEQSLALLRDRSFPVGEAFALATLGSVAWAQGDYDRATSLLQQCLALRDTLGQVWGAAEARMLLGRVECFCGAYADAEAHCREAFATYVRLGAQRDLAECLEALAIIAAAQGRVKQGARRWGAADTLRASIGAPLPPVERGIYAPTLAAMRAALGEVCYKASHTEGGMLSPEYILADL